MELTLFLVITAVFGVGVYAFHHHVKHTLISDFIKANCTVIFVAGIMLSLFAIAEKIMNYPAYYGNEASLGAFFHKVFVDTFYVNHPALHIVVFSAIFSCTLGAGAIWALAYTINRFNRRRGHGLPTPLD